MYRSLLSVMVFLLVLAWVGPLFSQSNRSQAMSMMEQIQAKADSIQAANNPGLSVDDSTVVGDSTLFDDEERKPQYIEREYNHKEQVITGGVIMLCVGLILVTSNNFNPKH